MFEYIGVLISVVLGLGLTHIFSGFGRMIQERGSIKFYWVHLMWCFNILIYILAIWWGMFWWNQLQTWTVYHYLFITLYSSIMFLLASLLIPWNYDKNHDFEHYFYKNRVWFFAIQLVAWLTDIPETLLKGYENLREIPHDYPVFIGSLLLICITGIITDNKKIHAILPIIWLFIISGFLSLTTLAKIITMD